MKATARQKHCQKGRGKFIVTEIRAGSGDNLMNEAQRLSVGFDSLMKLSVGHRWRAAVAFVYVGGSRVFINPFAAIRFHWLRPFSCYSYKSYWFMTELKSRRGTISSEIYCHRVSSSPFAGEKSARVQKIGQRAADLKADRGIEIGRWKESENNWNEAKKKVRVQPWVA